MTKNDSNSTLRQHKYIIVHCGQVEMSLDVQSRKVTKSAEGSKTEQSGGSCHINSVESSIGAKAPFQVMVSNILPGTRRPETDRLDCFVFFP